MRQSEPWFLSSPVPFQAVQPFKGLQVVPPVGIVERRVVEMADFYGLVAAPQWYTGRVPTGAVGGVVAQIQISQDSQEGPFIITSILPRGGLESSGFVTEITIQSGGRLLTEGRVRGIDAFIIPQVLASEGMPGPIVVLRGDTLVVGLRAPTGSEFEENDGVLVQGYTFRSRDGERLGDIADKMANMLRSEGEFYAVGVVDNKNASVNISSTMIVQTMVVGFDAGEEGVSERAIGFGATIGNYNPFPPQGSALAGLDVRVIDGVQLFDGAIVLQKDIRYPVREGQRLVIYPSYAGVEPAQTLSRIAIVGRRERG